MIKVENLKKRFGKLQVLHGVSFDTEDGKCTAIMGPNASGKTTTIKSILGLVVPDEGTITVNGMDIRKGFQYRNLIGYMPQIPTFPENITPRELINLTSKLRTYEKNHAEELIELFEIEEHLDKPFSALSGGTRQKVNAVLAFMFDVPILILDEPTVGLDPVSSRKLKNLIRERKEQGVDVIITSHIVSEIEQLADDMVFLLEGQVIFEGPVKEAIEQTQGEDLEDAIAKLIQRQQAA